MANATPDPRDLPRDPRLESPSTYKRDTITKALADFYERLPHIDPSDVHRAPEDGWPEITEQSVAARGLRKTAAAVDLLRHLPYIAGPECCWIAPDAYAVDYRAVVGAATSGPNRPWLWELCKPGLREQRFPPWVVQITTGEGSESACYMLDTMDGTVTKFVVTGPVYPDPPGLYADEDPRAWRDQWCDDRTLPLEQLVGEWMEKFRTMSFLGMPGKKPWPGVLVHQEEEGGFMAEETKAMREIYSEHGWPDNYRGEDCREAILQWWAKR
ncbi:hypothetical protein EV127DRAFT_512622 [Xylaria flabelliformis]|nr:hypothetical protein EV127DRAFT_512622 [Xylaria flabelliformis]